MTPSAETPPDQDRPRVGKRVRSSLRRKGILPRPRELKDLVRLAANFPTRGNELELFFDGPSLFDRMIADIEAATDRISMEIYTFRSDTTGRRFAFALSEAARRGVDVRVIYDSVGCFGVPRAFFAVMGESGIETVEYHPIAPWRKRFALLERNHRKSLIIDGRIGYTGGVNIGDEWREPWEQGGWRDTHARVEGPAAGDLEALFLDSWFRQSGTLLDLPRRVPREALTDEDFDSAEVEDQIYVIGQRGTLDRPLRRLYLLALERCRKQITITSAYLVPDRMLRRALRQAAERDVEVRLLVPDVSDVPLVRYASRRHFDRLLRNKIEVFLWQPSILHAKTAVVDRHWSTVGSSNLDSLSFNWNLEANFLIESEHTGEELEAQFSEDLRHALRVDLAKWRARPRWERIKEWCAALFGPIL